MGIKEQLEIKAALKISKPIDEVFEAIVDPAKMSRYFIATSTGRMESGKTVTWQFPEFDLKFPVRVQKVTDPNYISYCWDDMDGTETLVEISLKPKEDDTTFVSIREKGRDNDEKGIEWLRRNTEGWANFLACLKGYLEYGINLRKGAFDLSQMPQPEQ
jgi:uncharacterized protein YndB with AHSA1/START domain